MAALFFNNSITSQMITKQKKSEIIDNLKKEFQKSKLVMFANFHGLNVKLISDLRRSLRKTGAKYLVARKTLISKTLDVLNFGTNIPKLDGEVSITFAEDDAILPAKELDLFAKKNKTFKILGGIFENQYIGGDKITILANIPSREILLGQLVNIINSPRKGVVVALNGIMRNFASVLSEIAKKK